MSIRGKLVLLQAINCYNCDYDDVTSFNIYHLYYVICYEVILITFVNLILN